MRRSSRDVGRSWPIIVLEISVWTVGGGAMETVEVEAVEIVEAGAGELAASGADIYEAYLAELDACESTRRSYRAALRRWSSWLDARGLGALDADRGTVIAYREELAAAGLKPSTVNAYLSAVRSFYRWTAGRKIFPNIADGVRGLKAGTEGAKDALTHDQALEVLDVPGADVKAKRDRAMIALMLERGLRTVEVARADIGDLRQRGGEAVLYIQGKGREAKDNFVILSDHVLGLIYDYLNERREGDPAAPLFASCSNRDPGGRMTTRSISRVVKDRLEACGLSSARLTAHSLRHTCVTFCLLGGATVQEAQAVARHANISTTMVYAHNIDRMDGVGEACIDSYLETGERRRARA